MTSVVLSIKLIVKFLMTIHPFSACSLSKYYLNYDFNMFSFRSLELSQFNVKSLLRRAAASEALERYRQAYVDYKTALQIDCNIAAAHDGTNRYVVC